MKFKYIIFTLILLAVAVGVYTVSITFKKMDADNEPTQIKVATTIFPLYDITKKIAGEYVTVLNILPPGGSPHTFEVTPSTIKEMQGTSLIFTVGDPLDTWASEIAANIGNAAIKPVSEGINLQPFTFGHSHKHEEDGHADEHEEHGDETEEEEHEEDGHADEHEEMLDPHYWLDTDNAKIIAANIATELSRLDPMHADDYQKNLNTYQTELDAVRQQISNLLRDVKRKDLIVFHESWNYFTREFGLEIAGVFTTAPGQEPTPQQLKALHDTATAHDIHVVFSEPQLSPETIKPFVEDLNLSLYVLDPLGGLDTRDSLIHTLLYNAQTLNQALNE